MGLGTWLLWYDFGVSLSTSKLVLGEKELPVPSLSSSVVVLTLVVTDSGTTLVPPERVYGYGPDTCLRRKTSLLQTLLLYKGSDCTSVRVDG